MAETKYWICDVCHRKIEKPEDGWVEWIALPDGKVGHDLRLVHHRPASPLAVGCQFDKEAERRKDGGFIGDLPLTMFMGPGGLMRLLTFIEDHKLPTEDVLEMIKRIHIPGYERVRSYLSEAAIRDTFIPFFEPSDDVEARVDAVIQSLDDEEKSSLDTE